MPSNAPEFDALPTRMLLMDWFTRLAREAGINIQQRSGGKLEFTVADDSTTIRAGAAFDMIKVESS